MRVVVYGVGAIGGVVAASLALDGREVVGISRGRMLEGIRADRLTLISHRGRETVDLPCVASPEEIDWRPDDVIALTMKSHDTGAALAALRACGVYSQAIACVQNGVANERIALRIFPNVFGVVVMMPAQYLEPGVVVASAAPKFGLFDCGRYPFGKDAMAETVCAALGSKYLLCTAVPNVMDGKYGKLLMNVGNAVTAALGREARNGSWYARARDEAEAVYRAAGITHYTVDFDDPRRAQIRRVALDGVAIAGSSTVQSLIRATGSIETDYLNGEIAFLGRLNGIPTPVNTALMRAADRMVRDNITPGDFPEVEFARLCEDSQ